MNQLNINEAFMKPPGGYGRVFESMYKGSMVGAGLAVFALWPYVISHMRGHPEYGALIELNPVLLAFVLGCTATEVEGAIEKLEEPDPKSRCKAEGGRRLIKMGTYLYRVVNGGEYLKIRKAEADRVKHAEAQLRYERKMKSGEVAEGVRVKRSKPLPGEAASEKVDTPEAKDAVITGALPPDKLPQDPASVAFRQQAFQKYPDLKEGLAEKFDEI